MCIRDRYMIILPVWTEIIRMYHKNSYHHVRSEPPWVFRIIRRRVRCGTNSFRAPRGAQIYPAVRRGHSRSGMHSGSSRPHCISLRSAGTDPGDVYKRQKLKTTFGWHPRYGVKEAIGLTVEWCQEYEKNGDVVAVMDRQIAEMFQ